MAEAAAVVPAAAVAGAVFLQPPLDQTRGFLARVAADEAVAAILLIQRQARQQWLAMGALRIAAFQCVVAFARWRRRALEWQTSGRRSQGVQYLTAMERDPVSAAACTRAVRRWRVAVLQAQRYRRMNTRAQAMGRLQAADTFLRALARHSASLSRAPSQTPPLPSSHTIPTSSQTIPPASSRTPSRSRFHPTSARTERTPRSNGKSRTVQTPVTSRSPPSATRGSGRCNDSLTALPDPTQSHPAPPHHSPSSTSPGSGRDPKGRQPLLGLWGPAPLPSTILPLLTCDPSWDPSCEVVAAASPHMSPAGVRKAARDRKEMTREQRKSTRGRREIARDQRESTRGRREIVRDQQEITRDRWDLTRDRRENTLDRTSVAESCVQADPPSICFQADRSREMAPDRREINPDRHEVKPERQEIKPDRMPDLARSRPSRVVSEASCACACAAPSPQPPPQPSSPSTRSLPPPAAASTALRTPPPTTSPSQQQQPSLPTATPASPPPCRLTPPPRSSRPPPHAPPPPAAASTVMRTTEPTTSPSQRQQQPSLPTATPASPPPCRLTPPPRSSRPPPHAPPPPAAAPTSPAITLKQPAANMQTARTHPPPATPPPKLPTVSRSPAGRSPAFPSSRDPTTPHRTPSHPAASPRPRKPPSPPPRRRRSAGCGVSGACRSVNREADGRCNCSTDYPRAAASSVSGSRNAENGLGGSARIATAGGEQVRASTDPEEVTTPRRRSPPRARADNQACGVGDIGCDSYDARDRSDGCDAERGGAKHVRTSADTPTSAAGARSRELSEMGSPEVGSPRARLESQVGTPPHVRALGVSPRKPSSQGSSSRRPGVPGPYAVGYTHVGDQSDGCRPWRPCSPSILPKMPPLHTKPVPDLLHTRRLQPPKTPPLSGITSSPRGSGAPAMAALMRAF